MDKTTFAGLTRLAPGDPLSSDGFSFQNENPEIIDHYLEVGAVGHRHDAHAALADPTSDLTIAAVAGGGAILARSLVYATYTLLDADGGETRPVAAQTVTTEDPVSAPSSGPTVALDTTAGSLLTNTYLYALTFTDATGGETTIGPSAMIQRPPGFAHARVQVSGLTALLTAAGATGWRLWRSVGGGRFGFLAAGTTDTYTDDGSASLDCTMSPPTVNSTNGVNKIHVTVPDTQPAETVSYRIYLSTDGSFASPSLAGTFPIASAGIAQEFLSIDLADGSPPDVSHALPGAAKLNPDTDLIEWHWKRPVATSADLPTVGNDPGDVRISLDSFTPWVWTGSAWEIWSASTTDALASDTAPGDVKLTVAPVSGSNPIAVGDNDPRNSNSRTPTAHAATHAAAGSDPITITEAQVTGLGADLAAKAPLASPAFTGDPTAPTPAAGDNDVSIATTAFVQSEIAAGVGAPNVQTNTDYGLVLADAGKTVEMTSAAAHVLTVPTNASQAFRVGAVIEIARMGAGAVTIAAAGGVTLRSRAGLLAIGDTYGSVSLRKRAADEWVVVGDLA